MMNPRQELFRHPQPDHIGRIVGAVNGIFFGDEDGIQKAISILSPAVWSWAVLPNGENSNV